jgi:hypothetical protein
MVPDSTWGHEFKDNLIPIDNYIKAIWDSIAEMGRVPLLPQEIDSGYYTSEELGALGEQYIACLFEKLGIKKLPADRKNPSPDFQINLNSRKYLLETKIVRHIHKRIEQVLYELGRRENRLSLYARLERLVTKYKINLSPSRVHFLDERKLKNKIRKILRNLRFPITRRVTKKLVCPLRDYTLTIIPDRLEGEIIWPPENGVSLGSIISRKRRQIGNSDFLFVIVVGKTSKDEIKDLIYPGYNSRNRKILDSIWDLEYKTSEGKSAKIKYRLKAVFFLLPYNKKCLIARPPSVRISSGIRFIGEYLNRFGYRSNIITP